MDKGKKAPTALESIAHIPIPLCVQQSTLMRVTQNLVDRHGKDGGKSLAILSDNRSLHISAAEEIFVDYTRYCGRQWFTRTEHAMDFAAGFLGGKRNHLGGIFTPAVEAVARYKPNLVLLYDGHYAASSLPWWQTVRHETKVVLYVHNPLSRTYSRRELSRLISGADAVVFCAGHLKEAVEHKLGAPIPVPVSVIHNGIDDRFFADAPRAKVPSESSFEILFAGQVAHHKGVHILLDALVAARSATSIPISAKIVGSGTYNPGHEITPYESELRRSAERNGLDVTFLPFTDGETLRQLYSQSSAVCVPSIWSEGLPLVALEAMAVGSPVLCSTAPGLIEACEDAAVFSKFGDPGDLAEKIVQLAEDPEEQIKRSELGFRRASGFSWSETISRIRDLYDHLKGIGTPTR